jgi:hypothetical protein
MNQETIKYLESLAGGTWSSTVKKERLYELVNKCKEQFPNDTLLSVELGVFGGVSAFCIAKAHKDLNTGFIMGIDAWNKEAPLEGTNSEENNKWWSELDIEAIHHSFLQSCTDSRWVGYIFSLKGKSDEFIDSFRDDSVTLLHQDSNHASEVIIRELELWSPKVKVGGYWVADDTNWKESQAGYAKLPDFGFELVEQFDTWAIYKKVK